MSAEAVREAFRQKIAGMLEPDGFTYFETINEATSSKELPPRWYTLDFIPADDSRISLGIPALFRESGTVLVAIFTAQQIEDTTAVAAAETVRTELANWQVTSALGQYLRVLEAGPPNDLDGGDFRGAWYGITVDLRYTFDRMA
jgi:hypothetical protein